MRGLAGIAAARRRQLGQDEVPPGFLFPSVAAEMTAPGAPVLNPSYGGSISPAVNAQGQTMSDVLAAGGNPAALGPTFDTSQTGANIAPTMETSPVGSLYGAAVYVGDGAYDLAANAVSSVLPSSSSIPWWVWAAGGAAALILLVRSVK
jgi:hypothetical protein